MPNLVNVEFVNDIKELLRNAKQSVRTAINVAMVYTYYEIGRRIVEREQKGEDRAEYGKEIMQQLADALTKEFGRGYSYRNLKLFRQFYLTYSKDKDVCKLSNENGEMIFIIKNQKGQTPYAQSDIVPCDVKETNGCDGMLEKNKKMIFIENQKCQALYGKSTFVYSNKKDKKRQPVVVQSQQQLNNVLLPAEKQNMIFYENQKVHPVDAKSDIVPYTSDGKQFFLSWSHYIVLIRIKDVLERHFYEIETYNNNWSTRELIRQYDSGLYLRLIKSKNKQKILDLSTRGQILEKPEDAIKNPLVLDFLHLPEQPTYSEKELESRIIDNLQKFIKELGKGFMFVERQARLTFGEKHFYADLVFYNRILRCFVIIDLKIGEIKPQDVGQMQMYVNYYDREVKLPNENKTIGLLLSRSKNDEMVKLILPKDNEQIFASEYEMVLPSREDLIRLIKEK